MTAPVPHRQSFRLTLLALVVYFMIGARVLTMAGVPYTQEGGNLLFKLHPGTYLLALASAVRLCDNGMPLQAVWRIVWREKLLAFYIGGMLFCIISELLLTGAGGLVMLLDTFLPAGMLAVALYDMSPAQAAVLAATLRTLLLLNATIALGETMMGTHLVPDTKSQLQSESEFRAIALYDHPLTGAAATMLGLQLCPASRHRWLWPTTYSALMFAGLVAFGGRIALLFAIASVVSLQGGRLVVLAASRGIHASNLVPVILAFAILGAALSFALGHGIGDRLLAHLYWDPSAQTRLSEFQLLGWLRPEQVLFGCRRKDMIALLEPMRLEFGVDAVESFWLVMFIILGAFAFPIFALAIAALIKWLWDRGDTEARVLMVCLLLTVSSSNSLGHKSALMVMLVAAVLARVQIAPRRRLPSLAFVP